MYVEHASLNNSHSYSRALYQCGSETFLFKFSNATSTFSMLDIIAHQRSLNSTLFHGEDLQMGVILHRFNKNYQMKAVANGTSLLASTMLTTYSSVSVPTKVPNHLICWPVNYNKQTPFFWRLLNAPYHCVHEEKSLFVQRVKSWDAAAHRVWTSYAAILLFYWRRHVLGLKSFMMYRVSPSITP